LIRYTMATINGQSPDNLHVGDVEITDDLTVFDDLDIKGDINVDGEITMDEIDCKTLNATTVVNTDTISSISGASSITLGAEFKLNSVSGSGTLISHGVSTPGDVGITVTGDGTAGTVRSGVGDLVLESANSVSGPPFNFMNISDTTGIFLRSDNSNVSIGNASGSYTFPSAPDGATGKVLGTVGDASALEWISTGTSSADVTFSGTSTTSGEVSVYTNTSGVEIKESGIASADLLLRDGTVVMTGDLDAGGNNITNFGSQAVDLDAEILLDRHSSSTGVLTGGLLSIGTPNTTFSISDGSGLIYDDDVNVLTPLSWTGLTNIAVTNIATQLITYVSIDNVGAVIQRSSKLSSDEFYDEIFLGVVVHTDLASVVAINVEAAHPSQSYVQLANFMRALGFINQSGNIFSPAAAGNLKFDKSVGSVVFPGINYDISVKQPNERSLSALTDIAFQYRLSDGTNITASAVGSLQIDPAIYDDGTSTPAAVASNKYTTQRVYLFTSNLVKIQPGQTLYNSIALAEQGIDSNPFVVEPSIADNGLFRGYIIVKGNATDLTNTSEAVFLSVGKFGESSTAVGVSTTSLQNAYDNSVVGVSQIVTDTVEGPLVIQNGGGADNINVLEIANILGTSTLYASGAGDLVANRIITSSGSESAPSHTFLSQTGTGMYMPVNKLSFTLVGTDVLVFDAVTNTATLTDRLVCLDDVSIATSKVLEIGNGTAATPSLTFGTDLDTGIYRASTNNLAIATAGAIRAEFSVGGSFLYSDFYMDSNTIYGDNISSGNLTLDSTAHATKGKVTINSVVDMPDMPYMRRSNQAATSLTSGVAVLVPFATLGHSIGTGISYATGIFTINTAGIYLVTINLTFSQTNTATVGTKYLFYATINGTARRYAMEKEFVTNTGAISYEISGSMTYNFVATDVLRVYCFQDTGATQTMKSGTTEPSCISISKIH
jgi:hypothetical protein